MKKLTILFCTLFALLMPSALYAHTAQPTKTLIYINTDKADATAMRTMSVVTIYTYNIEGNNYFKLRDIAQMLATKDIGFSVDWNEKENLIEIDTDKPYISIGNELELNRNNENTQINCSPQNTNINVNGETFDVITYNIEGNNYFQLRQLGDLIGFEVNWLAAENAVQMLKSK